MKKKEMPDWICADCGNKYGSYPEGHLSTWHNGTCGICGEDKPVTEPRDYRYIPKYFETKRG